MAVLLASSSSVIGVSSLVSISEPDIWSQLVFEITVHMLSLILP